MVEEKITAEQIKETLNKICDNYDKCGLEAYIVIKAEPKMKFIPLSEKKDAAGKTFRDVLKNMFLEIIRDSFLSIDAEYVDGSQLADNQLKYYIFQQNEKFQPFKFLNETIKTESFVESDLQDAYGLVFKIRLDNDMVWFYQHLWSIFVPNRKKTNIMARVLNFENQFVLSEQKERLLTISRKIDILIMDNCLITANTDLLQKKFDFQDYIYQAASTTISQITSKNIIANPAKLVDYIGRGKPKYAKKMMRIGNSKVFNLTAEQLINKIDTLNRWKGKFEIDRETNQIKLNTYTQVENIIDLFDERFTRSDVTDTEYDTDVKTLALPT